MTTKATNESAASGTQTGVSGPGSISLANDGGYVAQLNVIYILDGNPVSASTGDITEGMMKSIDLPDEATKIEAKATEDTGIGWRTIFDLTFPSVVTNCYKCWGTTLDPSWEQISC